MTKVQTATNIRDYVYSRTDIPDTDKALAARIAICVAMDESSLLGPIWFGDVSATTGRPSTSRGDDQQTDAWVDPAVRGGPDDPRRTDAGAARLFLDGGYAGQRGLLSFAWRTEPIPAVCQQVQGSEYDGVTNWPGRGVLPFADNYARALPFADAVIASLPPYQPTLGDLIAMATPADLAAALKAAALDPDVMAAQATATVQALLAADFRGATYRDRVTVTAQEVHLLRRILVDQVTPSLARVEADAAAEVPPVVPVVPVVPSGASRK